MNNLLYLLGKRIRYINYDASRMWEGIVSSVTVYDSFHIKDGRLGKIEVFDEILRSYRLLEHSNGRIFYNGYTGPVDVCICEPSDWCI